MTSFSVTWDYRCPFARNAHEHVLDALTGGAEWDVAFVPFSLAQVHVDEGQTDVWERPTEDSGLLALQIGVVVRDTYPEKFPAVHRALFALRHDHGLHLSDEDELSRVLRDQGLDTEAVLAEIKTGRPLTTVRDQHTQAAKEHSVWGVPTFIQGDLAAFVRLMDRPNGDGDHARRSIERILDLLSDAPQLNEFKRTSLDH
jgi:hypothetical protein